MRFERDFDVVIRREPGGVALPGGVRMLTETTRPARETPLTARTRRPPRGQWRDRPRYTIEYRRPTARQLAEVTLVQRWLDYSA